MSTPTHNSPRTPLATFDTYAEAERAVDVLSDRHFPVSTVAIVGRGLHTVEQVTGRLTTAGAAWRSTLSGAVTGLFVGLVFSLLSWVDPLVSLLRLETMGVVIGAVLGLVFGTVVHLLQGGRRNFSSVSVMVPDTYELLVDAAAADRARVVLADGTGPSAAAAHLTTGGER